MGLPTGRRGEGNKWSWERGREGERRMELMREWQSAVKDGKKVESYAENQSGFTEKLRGQRRGRASVYAAKESERERARVGVMSVPIKMQSSSNSNQQAACLQASTNQILACMPVWIFKVKQKGGSPWIEFVKSDWSGENREGECSSPSTKFICWWDSSSCLNQNDDNDDGYYGWNELLV